MPVPPHPHGILIFPKLGGSSGIFQAFANYWFLGFQKHISPIPNGLIEVGAEIFQKNTDQAHLWSN